VSGRMGQQGHGPARSASIEHEERLNHVSRVRTHTLYPHAIPGVIHRQPLPAQSLCGFGADNQHRLDYRAPAFPCTCAVLGRGQGQAAADGAGYGNGGHRPWGVHSGAEPVPRRGERDLRGRQHLCWRGVHQERTHCFEEIRPGRMPLLRWQCSAERRIAARSPNARVCACFKPTHLRMHI